MKDTRRTRAMVAVALSAAIGAVLGEHYIRPAIKRLVQK